jgi:hypothetical protein
LKDLNLAEKQHLADEVEKKQLTIKYQKLQDTKQDNIPKKREKAL